MNVNVQNNPNASPKQKIIVIKYFIIIKTYFCSKYLNS